MRRARDFPAIGKVPIGAAIVNANGIHGTLGCLAVSREDRRSLLLTSHHVLFGAGAGEQAIVWAAPQEKSDPRQRIGRVRHGRCGTVVHDGADVFIDCATAEFDPGIVQQEIEITKETYELAPVSGDRVLKQGAATGKTEGIVVDTCFTATARVAGRRITAPGQIRVRPVDAGAPFTTVGDSGAALHLFDGALVGLLWGVDACGYGLACPIAPVLRVLHLRLADVEPEGRV